MTEPELHEPRAEWLTPHELPPQPPAAISHPQARSPRRIAMRDIRAVALRIAEHFQPQKVILFGSYAYGHPKPESDVDLLVIMETPLRTRQQRLEISHALSPRPFPLDIVVRTPAEIEERVASGDPFLREIMMRGKVLYECHRD